MLLGTLATAAATTVSAQAIDVSITPSNGTFTSPALQVTVVFCDYNTSLNLSSANMTLNGTSVRSSFTASSWHCPDGISSEKYSGTITLASGPNTFQASISDAVTGTSTGVAYDTLVMVQVTPKGTTINQPAHLTTTQMFSIQNKRSSAITFNLTPLCAASRNCSAPAQTSVAANSTGTVNMTYSVPPQSTSDVIKLRVASTSYPTDVDTGIVTVNAVAAMTVSFSNLNNDDQRLGLCAASCFAPVLAHSTLGYRSLGVNRAVTLQYHGDRSSVRPIVTADLTLPAGAPVPTDITLAAAINGAPRPFVNGDATLHFSTAGISTSSQHTYRIAGEFSASDLATGMDALQVTVAATYADGVTDSSTTPASTRLMVVNLNNYDILPTKGWTVAGVQRLYRQADNTVLVVEGDGSGVYFGCAMNSGVSCSGPSGDFSTLKYDGTSYTRSYPDSSKAVFNSLGKMTAVSDRWGNTVNFTYDGSGYLSTVGDPIVPSYFGLTYSSGIIHITPPAANGGVPGTARQSTVAYDGSGRITSITDPDGNYEQYTYDGSGRVATVRDRRGGITTYGYDPTTWKLTSLTLPAVPIDQGGGNTITESPVLHFRPWQTLAVPVSATSGSGAPPVRLDTARALLVGAVNDTARFSADRWGQPLVSTDPVGNTSTITRTGIFATTVVDILGHSSSYVYTGPFLTSAAPYGQGTTTYQYDPWGMVKQVSSLNGPTVVTTYDNVTKTVVSTTGGAYPDSTYLDSRGRPTRHADPLGHADSSFYDPLFGNLDSATVHDTAATGDYAGSRIVLDGFGRDSIVRGYNTPTVTRAYDLLGRDSLLYASAGAQPTRFFYDQLFLVRTVDPIGQVRKAELNALGWPTAVYDPGDTSKVQRFFYDPGGRVSRVRNRAGVDVAMTYDVAGRLTFKRGYSANDSLQYTYAYSPTGQVVAGYTEDLNGNRVTVDSLWQNYAGADSVVSWIAGHRFSRVHTPTISTSADTVPLRYTDANGAAVAGVPVYDRIRNWSTSTGALSSMVLGSQTVNFGYDNELLLGTVGYPSFTLTLTRNQQHLVTQRSYTSGTIDSVFGRKYVIGPYGTSGRIAGEWWRSGVLADGSPMYTTRGFNYDSTGALSEYIPGHTQLFGCPGCPGTQVADTAAYGYHYDGVANLVSEYNNNTQTTTTATFDPGNRLRSWNGITYDYDVDGNRSAKHVGGVETDYRWNAAGQLVGVTSGSSREWYDYTAFGDLFRRKTNGTVDRHFVWDQGQLVLALDGSGTSKIGEYAYTATDQPLAAWTGTNSTPYFYEHDERGNVIGVSSGPGAVESRHFSPWGLEEFGVSIPENTRFGWKGLPWEGGITQLYYVRNRWYDPQSRSFVSEDPIGLRGGLNSYAYAGNDPVNSRDPSGLGECFWHHVPDATVTMPGKVSHEKGYWEYICLHATGAGNDGDAPSGSSGGAPGNPEQGYCGYACGKGLPVQAPQPSQSLKVCSEGGFLLIGRGFALLGAKFSGYILPIQYDSREGASSGGLLEIEIPHLPSLAWERSFDWSTRTWSNSVLALAGTELGKLQLGVVEVGGFGDTRGDVGAYGMVGPVGAGGYANLSASGGCNSEAGREW